jgi:hypothetical protein
MATSPLPPRPTLSELEDNQRTLKKQLQLLKRVQALVKDDPQARALKKVTSALASVSANPTEEVYQTLREWTEKEEETRKQRLREGLSAICANQDRALEVISRDPLELRIAPFHLGINVEKDTVHLLFARNKITKTSAKATEIMAAWQAAFSQLEGPNWTAESFLEKLYAAWKRCSPNAACELIDVLPELTLLYQSKSFRQNPTTKNFTPYSRVQFSYDLWRLRRDKCFSANGKRLTLGTATGASAQDKKRVIWVEDGRGSGQYFLTIRFNEENSHA